jgi:multiple sugar transport system ATP-binding protein
LARDAAVFLFDEPLSNLDAKLRARMRIELAELRQRIARNMVYVTHDQVEAMTLADRIVVMNGGVVQQQGTPRELFENPANLFVAGFLGAPAMNFFEAKLEERDGRLTAQGEGYAFVLSDETRARLSASSQRDVIAGVRPSSFSLKEGDGSPIAFTVTAPEYLGATCVLAGRCGETLTLAETTAARQWRAGERETFYVAPHAVRLFDKTSGKAL